MANGQTGSRNAIKKSVTTAHVGGMK